MYSNSYAMLATELNDMIMEGRIPEYTIIRVNKLQCNTMQGKKVIIILGADVIRSGSQVGQRLGTPVAINADGTVNENDRKMAVQAGKRSGDDQAQGQPTAKKPLQESNNKVSNTLTDEPIVIDLAIRDDVNNYNKVISNFLTFQLFVY